MNPQENLTLAKFLDSKPKNAPPEASLRGACGRAYYAAFVVARDILETARFSVSGGPTSVHKRVLSLLGQSVDAEVLTAAGLLDQLRALRGDADYHVGSRTRRAFSHLDSQRAILLSHQTIATFEATATKSPRLFIPPDVA